MFGSLFLSADQRKLRKEQARHMQWAGKPKNVARVNELLEEMAAKRGKKLKDVKGEEWGKMLSKAWVQAGGPPEPTLVSKKAAEKQALNPYLALFGAATLAPLFAHALDPMSKMRAQRKLEAERVAKQLASQNKTAEQNIQDGLEDINRTLREAKIRAAKKAGKGSPALALKEDLV